MKLGTIAQRVADAAEILDFVQPGWADSVDTDILDMSTMTTDIGSLINRNYTMTYEEDGYRELIVMGVIPSDDEDYPDLTDAWRVQVKDRQRVTT